MSSRLRFAAFVLMAVLFTGSFGCSTVIPVDPASVANDYMAAFEQNNYSACYALLDKATKAEMALTDYVQRHETIYSALQVTARTCSVGGVEKTPEGYTVSYSVFMRSELIGDLSQSHVMTLKHENEGLAVVWHPDMILEGMDWNDVVRVNTLYPKRGDILDSEANAFALNTYATSVAVKVDEYTDAKYIASRLSPIINATYTDIVNAIDHPNAKRDGVAVLCSYLPGELSEELKDEIELVSGVYIDENRFTPIRYYPQETTMAHLLGYTAPITAEQLASLGEEYNEASRVGQSGLEASYEAELSGTKGVEVAIYSRDKDGLEVKKSVVYHLDAQNGADLELTIDYTLQKRADYLLETMLNEEEAGVIIAMEPKTGDILAFSSYPTYNPNMYTFGLSNEMIKFLNDPVNRTPQLNRATQGRYPPGSTVKPFTAALGLKLGKFTPQTAFTGEIIKKQWLPNMDEWTYPPITRVQNYNPPVVMEKALIYSDNIYFANVALTCGWDEMMGFYKDVGFNESGGEKYSFDVPVASPHLASEAKRNNLHELASEGFGQGEMLVTPLQMASIFSAFANDGYVMQPRVVKALRRMEGSRYSIVRDTQPEVWIDSALESEEIEIINPMLLKVIQDGTGSKASIDGITLYGKTGTAELDQSKSREIAWMIAFSGNMGYDRLVLVMLEIPANTGQTKYDLIREMMMP